MAKVHKTLTARGENVTVSQLQRFYYGQFRRSPEAKLLSAARKAEAVRRRALLGRKWGAARTLWTRGGGRSFLRRRTVSTTSAPRAAAAGCWWLATAALMYTTSRA